LTGENDGDDGADGDEVCATRATVFLFMYFGIDQNVPSHFHVRLHHSDLNPARGYS
jgi:hypothetical protein